MGIGDDCAVLHMPAGQETLVTTDFSLEGIHFRREWHPAESVGHRCLARGLSDIAAMGGIPRVAFLSLALPAGLKQSWVDQFFDGFLKLADRYDVQLAGGDTAQSPTGIMADIVVVGSAPRSRAIPRSGARPGDGVYVTGSLGASEAALRLLFKGRKLRPKDWPRHFHPEPRIEIGRYLREKKIASAMIDTSDGLSTDLAHICEESGVGAEIEERLIPRAIAGRSPVDITLALHGGEDYELLFAAPRTNKLPAKIAGIAVTRVGVITKAPGMRLIGNDDRAEKLLPQGWEHFVR